MAAETILCSLGKAILEKLASYAADEIIATWGAKDEFKKLHDSLETICVVLKDAEKKQSSEESLKLWLKRLKGAVYDIDDLSDIVAYYALERQLIEEGNNKTAKVRCFFSKSNPIILQFNLSQKIKEIRGKLDHIVMDNRNFDQLNKNSSDVHQVNSISNHRMTYSFVNESDVLGREEAKEELVKMVIEGSAKESKDLFIIPIVGIGGLGKTTLAKLVLVDEEIREKFDMKLWACVLEKFNLKKIITEIIKSTTDESISENLSQEQLGRKLHATLKGKKYLLVIDDVWTTNQNEWNELKNMIASCAAKGSVVLLTTRNKRVAKITGSVESYDLGELPFDVCMSIFKRYVSRNGFEIKDPSLLTLGVTIVRKCGGIPLAVKALGSVLCGVDNREEWERIAHSSLCSIELNEDSILPALQLSYDVLPYYLKPCFAYLSLFAKGFRKSEFEIIQWWVDHGLIVQQGVVREELEEIGQRYFRELLSSSLLQVEEIAFDGFVNVCKMHDLVHDLAMKVMGEELALVSYGNLKDVTSYVRHIRWDGDDDDLSNDKLSKELLSLESRRQVRTFHFVDVMGQSISKSFIEKIISTFPLLRVLALMYSGFEELPDSIGSLKHLRSLNVSYNCSIKALPKSVSKLLNLQSLIFHKCEQIEEMPSDIGKLVNLRVLMCTVSKQRTLPMIDSLRSIQISDCGELTSFSEEVEDHQDRQRINSNKPLLMLRGLWINNCPKLSSLPKSLMYYTALKELIISKCESLVDWNMGVDPPQSPPPLVATDDGCTSKYGLTNLEALQFAEVPQLVGLPDGLKSAAGSLKYLLIKDCVGLAGLPDWLESFKCLLKLGIGGCPNLSVLPNKGLCGLTSLQVLVISGCPQLSERCAKDKGDYWPHICHIPTIELDDSLIQQGGRNRHHDL